MVRSCRSEAELLTCIKHLLAAARDAPNAVRLVDLCIPHSPAHAVRLIDPASGAELMAIPVSRIAYCTRGEEEAFAFSHSGGTCGEEAGDPGGLELYHCSAFRAASKDEVRLFPLLPREKPHMRALPYFPKPSEVAVRGKC